GLVLDLQCRPFVHFQTILGLTNGHLRCQIRHDLDHITRRLEISQTMGILHLDRIAPLLHHQHFPIQLLPGNGQRHFIAGVKMQYPFGQGYVGLHTQLHLCAWQGLNITPAFLRTRRQTSVVWKDIMQNNMTDSWGRHHLEGTHCGRIAVCRSLKGQRNLRLQKRVTKCPRSYRVHRVTSVGLSLAPDQELHALRQTSTGLGLYLEVHACSDGGVLCRKRDVDLTRWQIAEWLHEDVHGFSKQAWLYEGH